MKSVRFHPDAEAEFIAAGECVTGQIDATIEPHLRATAPLTEYAWRYRYPGEPSEPEESEVRQALDRARAVVALGLGRVPVGNRGDRAMGAECA